MLVYDILRVCSNNSDGGVWSNMCNRGYIKSITFV